MVVRTTLKQQVHRTLVRWLKGKRLQPGERINEVQLAKALDVSRTPIREALRSLEHGGLLESTPFRGFCVRGLSQQIVSDLYPVLGALEALAVRLLGDRLLARVDRLRAINRRLLQPRLSAAQRYSLDRQWHELLTGDTGNRLLDELLLGRRELARAYDGSYARGVAALQPSHDDHAAIVAAVERRRFRQAEELLRRHWEWGVGVVCAWLQTTGGADA